MRFVRGGVSGCASNRESRTVRTSFDASNRESRTVRTSFDAND
jgi:hypothetical protein